MTKEGSALMKATGIVRRIDDLRRVVIPRDLLPELFVFGKEIP